MASILVGRLQLASGVFICYLAVKYVTLNVYNIFKKYSKVKFFSLDIKCNMLFGVQESD